MAMLPYSQNMAIKVTFFLFHSSPLSHLSITLCVDYYSYMLLFSVAFWPQYSVIESGLIVIRNWLKGGSSCVVQECLSGNSNTHRQCNLDLFEALNIV